MFHKRFICFISVLAITCFIHFQGLAQEQPLLAAMPAQSAQDAAHLFDQFLENGPEPIRNLCLQLKSSGQGDDTAVEYAVSGLAKHVTRSRQAEPERQVFALAVCEALGQIQDDEVKAFLIKLLELAGGNECVETLRGYITSETLGKPAIQALEAIGTDTAARALAEGYLSAPEPNRGAVLLALSRIGSAELLPVLGVEIGRLEEVAISEELAHTLAKWAAPGAEELLARLSVETQGEKRDTCHRHYLEYIRALADSGRQERAARLCRDLLLSRTATADSHIRCAALTALADIDGERAFPELLAAVDSPDPAFRARALEIAQNLENPDIGKLFAAKMRQCGPEAQAGILVMLSRRQDRSAISMDTLLEALKSGNKTLNRAAVDSAARILGSEAAPLLVEELKALDDKERIAAVQNALLTLPLEALSPPILRALPDASPSAKVALLEILAARRGTGDYRVALGFTEDPDVSVRLAAMKAAAAMAGKDNVSAILPLMIKAQTQEERDAAQAAVIELLLEHESGQARLAPLLEAIGQHEGEARTLLIATAHKVAEHPAEGYPELPPLPGAEADEEGFISLFNGKDLTGWIGDTEGYGVEDGVLVCKPGGNLYTEQEYANFIVRFEFKLPPGGNNGLGIRVPQDGQGAYDGMEIQILDDTAEKYKDLHPYQYHGSVYGIVPAKRGFLKPVGEWNSEEVTVNGRDIKVVLNGETIVEANLDEATKDGPMDGKEHPGLARESGHIAFLGHGDRVEFRNIRVKALD